MSTTDHNSVAEEVTVTIDGVEMSVPQGTLIIRAAEQAGIHIPRFCDHPLLKPQASCRQCLVDVGTPDREGTVRMMPKPQPSCAIEVSPGMVVNTQHTSEVADKAQHGNMEFLLINHPLDCPVCDKGGECPLQNQAMSNGRATSRFIDIKRTFPKPVKISTQIMLDRDRCILCQRCVRFQEQIAGDPFIALQGRGGGEPSREVGTLHAQQIGAFDETLLDIAPRDGVERDLLHSEEAVGPDGVASVLSGAAGTVGTAEVDSTGRPFSSYFSGNTIQICPVGALTSAAYRFRARPFDLVSVDSIAEHDASGAAIRIDHRRGVVMRRLSGDDPAVNEEWITDKDRFAFNWQSAPDVLTTPLVRNEETGVLETTSWSEAIHLAARGLTKAISDGGVGLVPGGRLTLEDAYGWSKFARVVTDTNDIDFRTRAHSGEELAFLGSAVAGKPMDVTFADLQNSPMVLLVGFEPEEEAGNVFLRLRKGAIMGTTKVATIAPFETRGTTKMRATLLQTLPGREADTLEALFAGGSTDEQRTVAAALRESGAIVIVGERLALSPGAYSAALKLTESTGARLAWIPRRAGDRGAVEVGLLPNLLPGGRPVTDADARVDAGAVWGVSSLPAEAGRDTGEIFAAAAAGGIAGLVLGAVDLADLPEPDVAAAGAGKAFTVQLEVRRSEISEHADVVLPVAAPTYKSGTFLNWEGRPRPFAQVFESSTRSDAGVLDMLASAMGVELGTATVEDVHREIAEFSGWDGARVDAPANEPAAADDAEYILATWRMMLDAGRGQDGEAHLAGTAHRPVVRVSPATAEKLGATLDSRLTVTGPRGQITLPVVPTAMPDNVVWLPQNSPGSSVYRMLGVGAGSSVTLSASAEVTQ